MTVKKIERTIVYGLFIMIPFLFMLAGCGSSNSSSTPVKFPSIKKVSLLNYSKNDVAGKVENGAVYYISYDVDTAVAFDATYTDSVSISFYLTRISPDTNGDVSGSDTGSNLIGSAVYNPEGGECEIVIPGELDTGSYSIISVMDLHEQYDISMDSPYCSSDTFNIVNEDEATVNITKFELTSRLAIWTDSDYTTNFDGSETITVNPRPSHISVNANIALCGAAANAPETTYIGFYIDLWQPEEPNYGETWLANVDIQDRETAWADLLVIDRSHIDTSLVTSANENVETVKNEYHPERLLYYYPISMVNDTRPFQEVSLSLDLWIPSDTDCKKAIDLRNPGIDGSDYVGSPDYPGSAIDKIKHLQSKNYTVWKVVMFIQNDSIPELANQDVNQAEKYTAEQYVRVLKIKYDDLFPNGSRYAPKKVISADQFFPDETDYGQKVLNKDFDWSVDYSDPNYGAGGGMVARQYCSNKGFVKEQFGVGLYVYLLDFDLTIKKFHNQFKMYPNNLANSWHSFEYVYYNVTLMSKNSTLGTKKFIGFRVGYSWMKNLIEKEKRFSIAGIPFKVVGKVPIKLGVEVSRGIVRGDNGIGRLYGGIKPYARLWAVAEGGLDFGATGAGVGAQLTLINIALPIGHEIRTKADDGSFPEPMYYAQELFAVRYDLSSLDGRVYLYAYVKIPSFEWCWTKVWFANVPYPCGISTNGPPLRTELDIVNWSAPIHTAGDLYATPISDCKAIIIDGVSFGVTAPDSFSSIGTESSIDINEYYVSLYSEDRAAYIRAWSNGSVDQQPVGRWGYERWKLIDINGGSLESEDWVYLISAHDKYLDNVGDLFGHVNANRTSPDIGWGGDYTKWQIIKELGTGKITYGEWVFFKSNQGTYLWAGYTDVRDVRAPAGLNEYSAGVKMRMAEFNDE